VPEQRIPVALVLGSGGARGLAHAGVIRALQDCGRFEIRSITGSSIGALIGGLHAGGKLDAYVDWVSGLSRGDVWKLLDFSFTGRGIFEGDRLMQKLSDLVGDARIEDLDIPFTAVASDIERRREVWITRGSLFEAIRASIAIPGFFTPVVLGDRLLVDGGLLSPLPIAPAQRHDVERIIAVSLNGTRGSGHHQRLQRQAEPPVIAEAEAAGAEDQGVVLVADRREEGAGGADRDRHQEGVDVDAEDVRRADRDGAHHGRRGGVVHEVGQVIVTTRMSTRATIGMPLRDALSRTAGDQICGSRVAMAPATGMSAASSTITGQSMAS
jgi:predicted acylesterase/phospholipase RssA